MTDFRWLIEAPGQRYLAVQRLHVSDNFEWTGDHDRALAFRSKEQADALMMAVRQMDRDLHGFDKGLFAFEATLGNAAMPRLRYELRMRPAPSPTPTEAGA